MPTKEIFQRGTIFAFLSFGNFLEINATRRTTPLLMATVLDPVIAPVELTSATVKPKILIVDDDYGPRESLRILLKYDYDVTVASSVAEGVEQLKGNRFDAIIMDNRMPGRTGLEGIGDMRKVDENVSIIMLTGYGTLETACEAFRNQATDFMTKPPDTDAMLEAVCKNVALTQAKRTRSNVARELAELNLNLSAELNETRPLAKLGQHSDEIIHDMGNPLTILTCCVELLQSKVSEMRPEPGTQWMEALGYVQMIKKSVQHCCSLSDAWRQVRDDIAENRETITATEFMHETVESLQPMSAISDVNLTTDFSALGSDVLIDVEPAQMRRVIHNLMMNAMQATTPGRGEVSVRGESDGNSFEISVIDNGSGIPAERLSMIFEAYYTTKQSGTGLGLAISKRIVEEHGGTLTAASELNRGSVFTVRLPVKA